MSGEVTRTFWDQGKHEMVKEEVSILTFLMAPSYQSRGDYDNIHYNEPEAMAVVIRPIRELQGQAVR